MNKPKSSDENIAEALQRMVLQMDSGESVGAIAEAEERRQCRACGGQNPRGNRFCARCGVPLQEAPQGEAPAATVNLLKPEEMAAGQHHYHHHYHHHYFAATEGQPAATSSMAGVAPAARGATHVRTPSGGTGLSRAEAAVRKLSQDWAQACNTKHLDDLVELYSSDATVVRPNVQPIRTVAAIREYFFAALEAGLGDVEMDPLRVELLGEFAYEVGRCTMLVPAAMGNRREERGKYVILSARQAGEWKVVVDCWSSDLSLAETKPQTPGVAASRAPAKSA
ncbi:MAG TPA: SgcJ/EcaC family oxidoreductase [Terriglobales bacterium]|nr:SgcJ/EcaC family oxidoreductase [Terriglobales bacterium]